MHQRSIVRIGVPLAVAALALTACGSRGESGGHRRRQHRRRGHEDGQDRRHRARSPATCPPWARASSTRSSSPSKQANDTNADPGWKLEVSAVDDEAKADVGKNAATKLAADDTGHRRRR